jgi:hypothetical protein
MKLRTQQAEEKELGKGLEKDFRNLHRLELTSSISYLPLLSVSTIAGKLLVDLPVHYI